MSNYYGIPVSPHTTDEFYNPLVTKTGAKLALVKNNKPTFAKSRRFLQYSQDARRVGVKVGPGSYENNYLSLRPPKYKATPLFCRFHSTSNRWSLAANMRRNIIKSTNT